MKVLCIFDFKGGGPIYGEECIVEQSIYYPQYQGDYYILKGYNEYLYRSCHFIPISEIDETEFERNYNKQLI